MTERSFTCEETSEPFFLHCYVLLSETNSSFGSSEETALIFGETAIHREGPGKDLLCTRGEQLLKFILMWVVVANMCFLCQWSQGEGRWWTRSWLRDVFSPVLFNVRFSYFPHLWNHKVKQDCWKENWRITLHTVRHRYSSSGNLVGKLLGCSWELDLHK